MGLQRNYWSPDLGFRVLGDDFEKLTTWRRLNKGLFEALGPFPGTT